MEDDHHRIAWVGRSRSLALSRGLARLRSCLLVYCAASSCSDAKISVGGGPLVAFNSYVEPIELASGELAYAAIVPGLRSVEILRRSGDTEIQTEVLAPPQEIDGSVDPPYPVAMTVADVSGDGVKDVLVFDPALGREPWLALGRLGGSFQGVRWTEYLPRLGVWHQLTSTILDSSGRQGIVVADRSPNKVIVVGEAVPTWTIVADSRAMGDFLPYFLARPAVVFSSEGWLAFQAVNERIVRIALTGAETGSTSELRQVDPQYLIPFMGFDHLTPVEMPGCGAVALGVGLLPPQAGPIPRSLQIVHFGETTFTAKEIPTNVNVTTLAAVRRSRGGYLVAVIGGQNGGNVMLVGLLDECGNRFDTLGFGAIEFSWRAIGPPPGHTEPLNKYDGIILPAREIEGGLELLHYDGFDVRILTAIAADAWVPRVRKIKVHEKRTDTSW